MSGIFGLLDLGTVPVTEPLLDSRSFRHSPTGCVIAADARIDYKGELCGALGIDQTSVDDARLILAAYLHWGEACLDHLFGDFAFAIWDPRARSLFCARDPFGMRPFYYHHAPRKRFVFASDARDVGAIEEVPYAINEGRVADYLVPELEWIDYTSTFYQGIHRLPPGHSLTVAPDGLRLAEYWSAMPGQAPAARSDADWVEAFIEVLTRAVDERLRAPPGRVGCMLSGGMDSGSVAALASGLLEAQGGGPLRTFSAARGRDDDCIETRRIHSSVSALGSRATLLLPDQIDHLDSALMASIEEPFDGEFLFMKAIFLAARNDGIAVLLDGGGGDVVLNEGSYVPRLIRRGRLRTAIREIRAEPSFWGGSQSYRSVIRHLLKALTPGLVKRSTRHLRRRREAQRFVSASLISPEFAERVDIEERCDRMYRMFTFDTNMSPALERLQKIRPNVSAGRERYGRLARSAGIESRDPFLDLRVVRFCAHVPGHLLLRDGWPKFILRQAMAGRLPDEVRWGPGKPHIGRFFGQRFLQRELAHGNLSIDHMRSVLADRVDAVALMRGWESFLNGGDAEPVNRAYVLSLWLEQAASRPVVKNQGFIYSAKGIHRYHAGGRRPDGHTH
jgi:asparagine synthase (glutamine-hydrolysing)